MPGLLAFMEGIGGKLLIALAVIGATCALAVVGVIPGELAAATIVGTGSLLLGGQINQSGVSAGASAATTTTTPKPTTVTGTNPQGGVQLVRVVPPPGVSSPTSGPITP